MKCVRFPVPLAALLAAACAPSYGAGAPIPEPGDRVRYAVAGDTGRVYAGRTVRLAGDTLIIERYIPSMTGGAAAWDSAAIATSSLARLEKRVGRRGNAGRGALIGAGVGVLLGVLCANEEEGWLTPTPTECLTGFTLSGAGTGALIGLLIRSDVWQPVVLPLRPRTVPGDPAIFSASFGIGVRVGTPSLR